MVEFSIDKGVKGREWVRVKDIFVVCKTKGFLFISVTKNIYTHFKEENVLPGTLLLSPPLLCGSYGFAGYKKSG